MAHAGRVDLTEDQTKRLEELARSRTLAARTPKPFIWTASANDILAKVARARKALDATHGAEVTK